MAPGLGEGGRGRDQPGSSGTRWEGESPLHTSPSLGDEEALGLKEGCSEGCRGGGWGRTGTGSGLLGLHPSPFQRPGPEFLVCPHLSPAVLHLAASVSLPLQPGLQFFPRRFPRIPFDQGAVAPAGMGLVHDYGVDASTSLLSLPPSLLPTPQKPRPQLLPPAEFQPRGGAFQPGALAGERGLGRWRSAGAQPQGGTGERAGPIPQLAVQSHRGGGCPRRRAQAVSASPHSTRG